MKRVPLYGKVAAGRVALVDDADYDLVMQYRWYADEAPAKSGRRHGPYVTGYRIGARRGRPLVRMHKLLTGWPQTDHKDRNGLNNQRANLRPATNSQNMSNRPGASGKTSRYKGVSYRASSRKWAVQIRIKGTTRHLGSYEDELEAARKYDTFAREVFGEYALLNFP